MGSTATLDRSMKDAPAMTVMVVAIATKCDSMGTTWLHMKVTILPHTEVFMIVTLTVVAMIVILIGVATIVMLIVVATKVAEGVTVTTGTGVMMAIVGAMLIEEGEETVEIEVALTVVTSGDVVRWTVALTEAEVECTGVA